MESADSGEMNDNDLLMIMSYFYWGLVTSEIKRGKQEGLVGYICRSYCLYAAHRLYGSLIKNS